HVEEQTDAETLVRLRSAQRQDGAARRGVEGGGIGRGTALGVDDPAFGQPYPLVIGDTDLALGTDTGADVEHKGVALGRGADAEWIGADASLDPSGRRYIAAVAVAADRGDEG